MGGGSGGGSRGIGDIQSLIEQAKKELRKSERREPRRNVFLSFAYEDVDKVNLLRAHAKNENSPIEFNDWSVSEPINSERAPYIKQKISERIAQSSVTVVFLSNSTSKSPWVQWEIEESIKQGKHVVGVYPQDSAPKTFPAAIKEHKIKCVPWPELADAITGLE